MAKKSRTPLSTRTADGGTMTFIANEQGTGGRIAIVRGYKETPEERAERLAACPRANTVPSKKSKARNAKGRRGASTRNALREY